MSEKAKKEKLQISHSRLLVLLRLNPAYYSFVSGIFISVSINLYTGIFSSNDIPLTWLTLLISAVATLVSSIFWTLIALDLDRLRRLAYTDLDDSYEILDKLILTPRNLRKLRRYFLMAFLMAVIGFASLPLGHL